MTFKLRHIVLLPILALGACENGAESDLPPQPPMWVVSDADSEITLYPTLHILPPETQWKSEELYRRIGAAEEVWFEIKPGSETDPALQQAMMTLGLTPGLSLSQDLSPNEVEKLKEAIAPLGMPFEAVDQMRPWLAATFVSVGALIDKGFNPNSGVEKHLVNVAIGKKFRALETAESQLQMMASLPEDTQLEMLRETLGEMDESVDMLKDLVADWAVGDVKDLEEELINEMKEDTPVAFDAIFTARNRKWVDQIERELKGSGTDFIAVGAGHLVGEDSVPAMLTARGYTVKRL